MNKVTVVKLRNYTIISNDVLRDKRLSLKAKGLLITVLGLPDSWDFSIQGISTILKEGRDSVTAAITELIEFGYCSRAEERDSDGKFIGTDYTFYEAPIIARVEPHTGNPFTDNPITENPTQVSKEEVSTHQEKDTGVSDLKNPSSKIDHLPSADSRSKHPAIVAVRDVIKRFPDKDLWDKIILRLGDTPDTAKLSKCWLEWKECGYNKASLKWIDWYFVGIPTRNGNGRLETVHVPNRPTAREMYAKIDAEEALLREQHDSTQR